MMALNPRSRAVRKGFARPLFVEPLRTFPSFEQASRFVAFRLSRKPAYRFTIQQTTDNAWTVCRTAGGAV